ncbi:hypothetical protein [Vulgatibacter sp.]|uniref:hypothetical protein n=1 Tax=Vulgatibacter sp. TaxID=1971226 RepID=UPI00356607FD
MWWRALWSGLVVVAGVAGCSEEKVQEEEPFVLEGAWVTWHDEHEIREIRDGADRITAELFRLEMMEDLRGVAPCDLDTTGQLPEEVLASFAGTSEALEAAAVTSYLAFDERQVLITTLYDFTPVPFECVVEKSRRYLLEGKVFTLDSGETLLFESSAAESFRLTYLADGDTGPLPEPENLFESSSDFDWMFVRWIADRNPEESFSIHPLSKRLLFDTIRQVATTGDEAIPYPTVCRTSWTVPEARLLWLDTGDHNAGTRLQGEVIRMDLVEDPRNGEACNAWLATFEAQPTLDWRVSAGADGTLIVNGHLYRRATGP